MKCKDVFYIKAQDTAMAGGKGWRRGGLVDVDEGSTLHRSVLPIQERGTCL